MLPRRFLILPRLPVLLAGCFMILVAITGSTIWLVNAAERDAATVAHAFQVEGGFHKLLRFIRRAESAERGYLLTRSPDDLAHFRSSAAETESVLGAVRALTEDNPRQQTDLSVLEPILRARLQDMRDAIAASDAGDPSAVRAVIGRGRGLMEDITARVEGMMAEEDELLAKRSAEYGQTKRLLLASTIIGALLIVVLAAISILQVRRSARSLEDAHRALQEANRTLEATVEERTAELRESNDEIQRYAYIVSHDLRAPLVNIMGFTSELEALRSETFAAGAKPDGDPERVAVERDFDESIGFIKAAILKMEGLIGAILKISREGRRAFRPEHLDMGQLLQGLADAQRHQVDAVGATVVIGDLPSVSADRLAVEQIFANLLDNAIKYLDPSRPGRIEILGRDAGPRVRYEIRDNGRGISPEDHTRVFELFRRAGVPDRPGEGIGLAHVKALVRSLGGRIDLSSEFGVGTTFTVFLPKAGQSHQIDAK
jgi:signal transduction histidine kinase